MAWWLKRRHTRKLEAQRARSSGFTPPMTTTSLGSRSLPGQEMWGPHQHMAHTRGWEYGAEEDAEFVRSGGKRNETQGGSGLTGKFVAATHGSRKRKEKRARGKHKHHHSHDSDEPPLPEDDNAVPQRRLSKHRHHSERTSSLKSSSRGGSRHGKKDIDQDVLTPIPSRGTDIRDPEKDPDEIQEL
ncbi:MAG: hypothetical protein Q9227_002130 [Pyrenula ochraceoflavens]